MTKVPLNSYGHLIMEDIKFWNKYENKENLDVFDFKDFKDFKDDITAKYIHYYSKRVWFSKEENHINFSKKYKTDSCYALKF